LKFFAAALLATALTMPGPSLFAANDVDESTGLKIDTGWEHVRAHCGGCHSHALVTSQRADRQTWLDMIRWMQATQNLWPLDQATETAILDYLAANYPPQPNRRRAPIPTSLMPGSQQD
jgi:hypothetical protein